MNRQTPSFLNSAIRREEGRASASVRLHAAHQGWMELPHGGVLMSMILEVAHYGLAQPLFDKGSYPVHLSFRWGGPSLYLGQKVEIGVQKGEKEIRGWVKKDTDPCPTLTAVIRPQKSGKGSGNPGPCRLALPAKDVAKDPWKRAIPLPYAHNCFVCGSERTEPGLAQRFFCWESQDPKIVFTFMAPATCQRDDSEVFRLADGQRHPGCLAAVLDEAMGWSGFVHARQGAVTVKLEIDILGPASPAEELLCIAACTGTRGKSASRQFWYAEGSVVPVGKENPLPVMLARGQWLAIPKLTEEMKRHLMPPDWTAQWFPSEPS